MLIWTRLGILVPLLAFAGALSSEILVEYFVGDSEYYQTTAWPMFLGLAVAGLAIWLLGRKLNRDAAKKLVDPETGKEIWVDRKHTFFFIPMQYWGIGVVALGFAVWFAE